MKKFIQNLLGRAGYEIIKKDSMGMASMEKSLYLAKDWNLNINTIIDVGAAQGRWTENTMRFWDKANYMLIEPLAENEPHLKKIKQKHSNVDYKLVVAGAEAGEVTFSVSKDLDGSGVYQDDNPNARKVPVLPLDDCVTTEGNYLLKLDTHGFELPIFEGASRILSQTSLLVVEVYGYYVSPTAKLFPDICKYLEEKGFRFVTIADVMYRKKDQTFWQADFFFLRKDHPIFKDNTY